MFLVSEFVAVATAEVETGGFINEPSRDGMGPPRIRDWHIMLADACDPSMSIAGYIYLRSLL